jgi:hypothetical protein
MAPRADPQAVARVIALQKERQLMQIASLARSGTGGGRVAPTERRMVRLEVRSVMGIEQTEKKKEKKTARPAPNATCS